MSATLKRGVRGCLAAESRLVRDAIVPMAAYAAVTDHIKVGSGVINNWSRNIGLLAATFPHLGRSCPKSDHLWDKGHGGIHLPITWVLIVKSP